MHIGSHPTPKTTGVLYAYLFQLSRSAIFHVVDMFESIQTLAIFMKAP